MLLCVFSLPLNESIEGANTTATGNRFQELVTPCENLHVGGISFVLDSSTRLLCPLICPDTVGRREDLLGAKSFLRNLYIKIGSPHNL